MALPFAAALIGGGGATVLDYALGRPLNLWGRSIDAQQTPAVRQESYSANFKRPNILPAPDAIIEAFRRGYINDYVARWACQDQGVAFGRPYAPLSGMSDGTYAAYAQLWAQVGKMRRSRPDPATWARLYQQRRISLSEFQGSSSGLDADWDQYHLATQRQYQLPGLSDLLQLRRLGRISQADYDQGARALGWYDTQWMRRQEMVTPLPSSDLLMRNWFLGNIDDTAYARYMEALGHTDPETRGLIESGYYQIPSGAELVNLAVRDAWNSDVVNRWGYDDEFPEPLRFWLRAQGWDWGQSFTGNDGQRYPGIHWPRLFWRAHWQVLPPGLSYQMYRRLRPERLDRYREQFPGITAFTLDDLRTVLRVHDYPPKAREWLAAINSQPLRMYTIRTAYRQRVRDRQWALEQLKDGGYLVEDANAILDVIDNEEAYKTQQAVRNTARRLIAQTAQEVLAGYADGLVPDTVASQRLQDLGWTLPMAVQALRLADSRQLRQTARTILQALRRDYLNGVMPLQELQDRLTTIPLAAPAVARYLQRWTAERSLQRRSLSASQVLSLAAAGALDAPTALARLANLGWVEPDASLLTGRAVAHALQAAQRAQDLLARKAQAQRKALEAAARQAAAAARQAQSELRRITPLATIRVWFQRGYRKAPWVRLRLLAMGLDTASIDTYLVQWTEDEGAKEHKQNLTPTDLQRLLKRQTPLSTVKRLWQTGVVTDSWARQRLADSGYTPETINVTVASWRQSLTARQSGPAPEGSKIPATGA